MHSMGDSRNTVTLGEIGNAKDVARRDGKRRGHSHGPSGKSANALTGSGEGVGGKDGGTGAVRAEVYETGIEEVGSGPGLGRMRNNPGGDQYGRIRHDANRDGGVGGVGCP